MPFMSWPSAADALLPKAFRPPSSHGIPRILANTRSAFDCKQPPRYTPVAPLTPVSVPFLFCETICNFPEVSVYANDVARRCSPIFQAIRDHSLSPGSRDCVEPPDRSTTTDPTAADRPTATAASAPRRGDRRSREGKCVPAATTAAGATATCSSSSGLRLSRVLRS